MMTLEVIDSPITKGSTSGRISPDDIMFAIRVCSGYEGINALKAKATWREKWVSYKLTNNNDYSLEALSKFAEYIKLYCEMPKVWNSDTQSDNKEIRKEKIPASLQVASFLLKNTTLSEQEIWRMPIGKCYWYVISIGMLEGSKVETISTEDEDKMDSELEQLTKLQAELSNPQGKTK